MPKSVFEYNGANCQDWNCYKLHPINFPSPAPDFDLQPVPGRNGNIILDNGRYANLDLVIECYIMGDFKLYYDSFRAFLLADRDYHKLVDSLYPDEFRLACVRDVKAKVKTPRGGTIEITMSCMPQRFLKSGEIAVDYPDSSKSQQTIYKYTDFSSYSKTNLLDPVGTIKGYDMANMEYYVLDMTGHTGSTDDAIVIEGDFDEFFAVLCNDNPLTEAGNISATRYTQSFVRPTFTPTYWILPIAANIKIYIEGVLEYEDNIEHKNIQNPTLFAAKPVVKLSVPSSLSETVGYLFAINENGVLMRRSSAWPYNAAQTITIDCEAMDAYSLPEDNPAKTRLNWNASVSFLRAPEIRPGNNDLAYDSTISDLQIIPKWWTL